MAPGTETPTHDEGFSLIELMTVVLILGILVSTAFVSYVYSVHRSRAISCQANRRILNSAARVYEADTEALPHDIEDLRGYANDFDVIITCPADRSVELVWDDAVREVTCSIHP